MVRHLLLERKAMTNLDSVLKSRNITLLTKVRIVKAVVFPIVMYEHESGTMKKAEHWKIDAFKFWCWKRLLRKSPQKGQMVMCLHYNRSLWWSRTVHVHGNQESQSKTLTETTPLSLPPGAILVSYCKTNPCFFKVSHLGPHSLCSSYLLLHYESPAKLKFFKTTVIDLSQFLGVSVWGGLF